MKNVRTIPSYNNLDPNAIANNQYNDAAGSQKVSEVGRHLLPIPVFAEGVINYTTNATTAKVIPKKGMGLAVYNNSNQLQTVTLGTDGTVSVLAAGVTDGNGHVGIPCMPNNWTIVATGLQNFVIASSANLLVFLISDNSLIVNQNVAQTPNY